VRLRRRLMRCSLSIERRSTISAPVNGRVIRSG
jgi:hypothetical protein